MFKQAAIDELIDPLECGVFYGIKSGPRSTPVHNLSLREAIDRFRKEVVMAVTDVDHKTIDTRPRQTRRAFEKMIKNFLCLCLQW